MLETANEKLLVKAAYNGSKAAVVSLTKTDAIDVSTYAPREFANANGSYATNANDG